MTTTTYGLETPDYVLFATHATMGWGAGDVFTGGQMHFNADGTTDHQPTATLADVEALSAMDAEADWEAAMDEFRRLVHDDLAS